MKYLNLFKIENENIEDRYTLAVERIELILQEETVKRPYRDYFTKMASFLMLIDKLTSLITEDKLKNLSLEELKELNHKLYEDILEENYEESYANPSLSVSLFERNWQALRFLYAELRGLIASAYEGRKFHTTLYFELFIEVYNCFETMGDLAYKPSKMLFVTLLMIIVTI